jgi:hypothetical protein
MATMLYGVKATDKLVFGPVAVLLGFVAPLASYSGATGNWNRTGDRALL